MSNFSKLFIRDKGRCVYCRRDLKRDFDAFWSAQMDHLVPGEGDGPENMVTACYVCNNLKGNFKDHKDAPTREKKLRLARQYILQRRAEKEGDFESWAQVTNSN